MLIELNEDTLQDLVSKNENEALTFVLVDAENSPESRKLANVSNLPTFATFVNGKLVNETQTNKQEVLADLVNEIA
jgi:hypothetical protein